MKKFITDIFCINCNSTERLKHNGFNDNDDCDSVNTEITIEDLSCPLVETQGHNVIIRTVDIVEFAKQSIL